MSAVIDIREQCRGRWANVLVSLGFAEEIFSGRHQACPECGGKDRFRWNREKEFGICNQCGSHQPVDLATGLVNLTKLKAAQKSGQYNQKVFLADPSNWSIAGGKEAFLSDSGLQDKAFTDMQNRNFTAGVKSGAISMAASPEQVAGFLKASHLGGASGASDYFLRGVDKSDGNTFMSTYAKQGAAAVRATSVNAPSIKIPAMPTTPKIPEGL